MTSMMMGPTLPISEEIDKMKYRGDGEDLPVRFTVSPQHSQTMMTTAWPEGHPWQHAFLPAGRVQTTLVRPG